MDGDARTRGPGLVDVASGLGKRTLAVESASLTRDQFTAGFFRHAAGAEGALRLRCDISGAEVNVGNRSC